MSQASHSSAPAVATEGQITDGREVISAIVDSTNQTIKFGRAVTFKTMPAPGSLPVVEVPDAAAEITGDAFAGIVVFDPTRELPAGANEFSGYVTGDVCSVLRRGKMMVISESAVSAYQQVFARHVAGAGEELGALRHDADGGDATAIPGSRFLTTAGAGGLAEIELDVQD